MTSLYYLILKNIIASIIGSAFASWFKTTRMGTWCYAKLHTLLDWATKKEKETTDTQDS